MPDTPNPDGGYVITGAENIAMVRKLSLKGRLYLELCGLTFRTSTYALVKREFHLRGNREKVYLDFCTLIGVRPTSPSHQEGEVHQVKKNEPKIVLTPEEEKLLLSCASAVWQYIGGDLLQCVADAEERDINTVNIPRDEVVEVVCDADRLYEEVRRSKQMTPNLEALFKTYDGQLAAYVKKAFGFARYGM